MGQEDDKRALLKIMNMFRAISIIIMLGHIYWHCYGYFKELGLFNETLNKVSKSLDSALCLFSNGVMARVVIITLLAISIFGSRGTVNEKISWPLVGGVFVIGMILFWITPDSILYILSLSFGYLLILLSVVWSGRLLQNSISMDDLFNNENESFPQQRRLIKNNYSVNLKSKYYYNGRYHNGWINVVNPFRGIRRDN